MNEVNIWTSGNMQGRKGARGYEIKIKSKREGRSTKSQRSPLFEDPRIGVRIKKVSPIRGTLLLIHGPRTWGTSYELMNPVLPYTPQWIAIAIAYTVLRQLLGDLGHDASDDLSVSLG